MDNILCPFCNALWTREMIDVYNGNYGCDTGCEYETFVVKCSACKKVVYIKGEFGSHESDKEKQEDIDYYVSWNDIAEAAKKKRLYPY